MFYMCMWHKGGRCFLFSLISLCAESSEPLMLLHPTLRTAGVDTAWLSDVASAESSSPVTCNPALPTFTLLGQGDSLPSYSLVVRKGEPLGSRWMRTRTVYADPKSEPNQRGSSSLPRCQLPTTSPRHPPPYRDRQVWRVLN